MAVIDAEARPWDTQMDVELNDVAGHLNAQHGRLVDLTIQLLADRTQWQGQGVWTVEQYLAWRVGLSPHRARQIAAAARRADELPECIGALRRGELSIDQLAPIVDRVPWWADEQMCTLAKGLTASQVSRLASEYRFPDIPHPDAVEPPDSEPDADPVPADDPASEDDERAADADDADAALPQDRCHFHTGDDDRFRLHLETDAVTGALLEAALVEARDRLFQDGRSDVDWVDAMREMANRSLDAVSDAGRRDRHRIHLHLDTNGAASDAAGWTVPDAVRRHLTCDGTFSPTFTDNALPISVGRAQRIVPERTRRLVIHRDHGCRVPGCGNGRFLEVHHIIHWLDDGPSDTWNLVALCPHHHRLHHQGRLGISGNADDPDGITFTTADGSPITRSGARPTPPGAPPPPPDGRYRHPYGERLDRRWVQFDPPTSHRN